MLDAYADVASAPAPSVRIVARILLVAMFLGPIVMPVDMTATLSILDGR